jgi:hypothetical protein
MAMMKTPRRMSNFPRPPNPNIQSLPYDHPWIYRKLFRFALYPNSKSQINSSQTYLKFLDQNTPFPSMGEDGGPAPHRVQDLALNLTWFRVGVDKTGCVPLPFIPSHQGREDFGVSSENVRRKFSDSTM